MKKAKDAGKLISFDINYRDRIWGIDECMTETEKVFPFVDLLKISEEELVFTGGEGNIPAFMEKNRIAVTVLTRGSEGARIYYGEESRDIEPVKVPVTDTTGAGDAFWGGFLSSILSQGIVSADDITRDKLVTAGRYGTVSGGLCVQKPGGIPALPRRKDIERRLKEIYGR